MLVISCPIRREDIGSSLVGHVLKVGAAIGGYVGEEEARGLGFRAILKYEGGSKTP